jgi:hypothetical protein
LEDLIKKRKRVEVVLQQHNLTKKTKMTIRKLTRLYLVKWEQWQLKTLQQESKSRVLKSTMEKLIPLKIV